MKVLVISATFPPMRSGGARFAACICEHLGNRGLDVNVLTSQMQGVLTSPCFSMAAEMRGWGWINLPRILWCVARHKPDILNLHFSGAIYQGHPMITFLPPLLRRLFPRLRFVTHIEYPEPAHPERGGPISRILRKVLILWLGKERVDYGYGYLLSDSNAIIVLSEDHVTMLAAHCNDIAKKCFLIPPPPTIEMCAELDDAHIQGERARLGYAGNEFIIVYFGYLYSGKGLETLLRSMLLMVQRQRPIRLLVIGGGNEVLSAGGNLKSYSEELQEMARGLGIADIVTWAGDCPDKQASLYLRISDACVLPFDEGVKLHRSSFAVALAHGLPVIASKTAATEAVIVNSEGVLLCQPKDPVALAQCIETVMTDPVLCRRLRSGALRLSHDQFSWEKAIDKTLDVFNGVKGERSS